VATPLGMHPGVSPHLSMEGSTIGRRRSATMNWARVKVFKRDLFVKGSVTAFCPVQAVLSSRLQRLGITKRMTRAQSQAQRPYDRAEEDASVCPDGMAPSWGSKKPIIFEKAGPPRAAAPPALAAAHRWKGLPTPTRDHGSAPGAAATSSHPRDPGCGRARAFTPSEVKRIMAVCAGACATGH